MVHRPPKAGLSSLSIKSVSVRTTPVVLVVAGMVLLLFHRFGFLPAERLRSWIDDVTAPILAAVTQPFVTASESFEGLRTLRALKAENIRLKQENTRLQQWYEAALKFQAQNKSLKDLLNVKVDASFDYITTRVVSDPGGSFVKSVLLPVGAVDHVQKGSAVMAGRGLIGRITEVGRHSSRALLVTDLNSHIPVVIQNTRIKAILAGKNDDTLRLERFPADSGIVVGSRVVTSSDSGVLPPDIPIGIITEVTKNGVLVKPLADLDSVTYVQIINTYIDPGLITGTLDPADISAP